MKGKKEETKQHQQLWKHSMCFTMGARRRKLNRELLGIDREEEKDEESFGFKGTVVVVVVVVVADAALKVSSS
jgi:hypothetical protein